MKSICLKGAFLSVCLSNHWNEPGPKKLLIEMLKLASNWSASLRGWALRSSTNSSRDADDLQKVKCYLPSSAAYKRSGGSPQQLEQAPAPRLIEETLNLSAVQGQTHLILLPPTTFPFHPAKMLTKPSALFSAPSVSLVFLWLTGSSLCSPLLFFRLVFLKMIHWLLIQ